MRTGSNLQHFSYIERALHLKQAKRMSSDHGSWPRGGNKLVGDLYQEVQVKAWVKFEAVGRRSDNGVGSTHGNVHHGWFQTFRVNVQRSRERIAT